jgi:hypothetical protein
MNSLLKATLAIAIATHLATASLPGFAQTHPPDGARFGWLPDGYFGANVKCEDERGLGTAGRRG